MTLIQTFHGNATNGTELTAVYAEQPAANVAFALVFPGNDLPRLVHWGRPLAAPATVIDMFDAQMPQRVSGALDYTSRPSVGFNTQSGCARNRSESGLTISGSNHRPNSSPLPCT